MNFNNIIIKENGIVDKNLKSLNYRCLNLEYINSNFLDLEETAASAAKQEQPLATKLPESAVEAPAVEAPAAEASVVQKPVFENLYLFYSYNVQEGESSKFDIIKISELQIKPSNENVLNITYANLGFASNLKDNLKGTINLNFTTANKKFTFKLSESEQETEQTILKGFLIQLKKEDEQLSIEDQATKTVEEKLKEFIEYVKKEELLNLVETPENKLDLIQYIIKEINDDFKDKFKFKYEKDEDIIVFFKALKYDKSKGEMTLGETTVSKYFKKLANTIRIYKYLQQSLEEEQQTEMNISLGSSLNSLMKGGSRHDSINSLTEVDLFTLLGVYKDFDIYLFSGENKIDNFEEFLQDKFKEEFLTSIKENKSLKELFNDLVKEHIISDSTTFSKIIKQHDLLHIETLKIINKYIYSLLFKNSEPSNENLNNYITILLAPILFSFIKKYDPNAADAPPGDPPAPAAAAAPAAPPAAGDAPAAPPAAGDAPAAAAAPAAPPAAGDAAAAAAAEVPAAAAAAPSIELLVDKFLEIYQYLIPNYEENEKIIKKNLLSINKPE